MKIHLAALAALMAFSGVAYAAEGSATGNGTSTPAGPASTGSGGAGPDTSSAGNTMPSKSGNAGSQGEANGTSTPAGPANSGAK
jgi:hypothetical protein